MTTDFYILAMGRSGTTLLQNMLNVHPNAVVPPESFFVLHLYTKYKDQTEWGPRKVEQFINDLYTDRPFRLVWQVKRETVEAAFKNKKIDSYSQACNCVRTSFQESFKSKKVFAIGDKNPLYSTFAERVLKINPKAKIVHLVRDPRGTANGHINTFNRKDALMIGMIWTKYNECILKLKKQFPEQYLLVKYEDLIANPRAAIATICTFLNIENNPEILEYRKATVAQYNTYSTALKWKHENLLKPIDIEIAEKWKTALSRRQIRHIEYTTHKTASRLGYHFEKPAPDLGMLCKLPFSRLKFWLLYGIIHLYFNFPFAIRKIILGIRSFLWDKKYKKT